MKQTAVLVLCCAFAAPAMAGWDIIAKGLATEGVGIGFNSEKEGFFACDANGVGPEILKTVDGGVTWNQTQANFGIDLLLLGAAATPGHVVVSSVFGELYSDDDGQTFHQSIGGGLSQSVRFLGTNGDGGKKFGCAGTYRGQNGVALTVDGGKTFQPYTSSVFQTYARYAAYPSDTTWYVAAGQFPQAPSDDDDTNRQDDDFPPSRARYRRQSWQDENGRLPRGWKPSRRSDNVGDFNGYAAQLAKTTDGGKTWVSQLFVNNSFYFNGIDCTSTEHCCAVGESSDAPFLGAGIWCTNNGGANWNRTFYAPYTTKSGFSLIDIRWATSTHGWAVGGELNTLAPKAWFVETKDGGQTWDPLSHQLFGFYALGLDVVDDNIAYAAIDNTLTQSSGVAKYTA